MLQCGIVMLRHFFESIPSALHKKTYDIGMTYNDVTDFVSSGGNKVF